MLSTVLCPRPRKSSPPILLVAWPLMSASFLFKGSILSSFPNALGRCVLCVCSNGRKPSLELCYLVLLVKSAFLKWLASAVAVVGFPGPRLLAPWYWLTKFLKRLPPICELFSRLGIDALLCSDVFVISLPNSLVV